MARMTSGRVSERSSLLPLRSLPWSRKRSPRNSASPSLYRWIIVPIAPSSTTMRSSSKALRRSSAFMALRASSTLASARKRGARDPVGSRAPWSTSFVSRVLFRSRIAPRPATIILLGRPLPDASSSLPASSGESPSRRDLDDPRIDRDRADARLCGLAPDGVCRAVPVTGGAVGSYPAVSPLPAGNRADAGFGQAVFLCCTFLHVSATGRYPASHSVELGLSSRGRLSFRRSDRRRSPERRRRRTT